jgi:hypothetical protein
MAELIEQTQPEERKYVLEFTQSEIGTLFACMDKTGGFENLQLWNNRVGNEYTQLKTNGDWVQLSDLIHSLAIHGRPDIIMYGRVKQKNG